MFAVGQPFLEHLIAAELVAPNGGGDVAPEGTTVATKDAPIEGSFHLFAEKTCEGDSAVIILTFHVTLDQ